MEELRLLKEELPMAVKRAAEAFREDPTRSSLNSATFRKARMADDKSQQHKAADRGDRAGLVEGKTDDGVKSGRRGARAA
jgi:hypothetical protein